MRINEKCEKCLMDRQLKKAEDLKDMTKRAAFVGEITNAMKTRKILDSAPYMVSVFNKIAEKYFGPSESFKSIKDEYNSLVMNMETEIEEKIAASKDPLEMSMIYGRIGNYIDFSAMNHVEKAEFLRLLDEKSKEGIDQRVYGEFIADCEKAKTFLLLCDNCGEVVLDKLFLRQLHKRYPGLKIYAMVRGAEASNDATLEDAVFCGLDKEAEILSSGAGITGTVVSLLPKDAKEIFDTADVIYSKGQGNYESLSGSGIEREIYYSFLCKCDHFVEKFAVPRLTGKLVKE